ncbi:unnamed protein product [Dracunculus medinensis]|uniref:AAA domain-containing protein n=1 Tax=Dracunculus medinensis TaxID=318479 RepID=A0A0N4UIU1_DRAME|nr:unnamed protein product [Dracunculus medinensis]
MNGNDDDYNIIASTDQLFVDDNGDNDQLIYPHDDDENFYNSRAINRKRPLTIEECDEIDWHMKIPLDENGLLKKFKKDENDDHTLTQLVNRILSARKRKRILEHRKDLSFINEDYQSPVSNELILRFPPIDGCPWIGISSSDNNQRFYVRKRRKNCGDIKSLLQKYSLNSKPIEEIVASAVTRSESDGLMSDRYEIDIENKGLLWVDKYTPRSYIELLSDEKVNRLLLHWVKLWDLCVFNRSVVLISGVAGVGKTTLASIVAKHCGYHVINMNASDERNVGDFEKCIEGALRAVRTLDSVQQPNCLVVDEIDGAPIESIKFLCKILTGTGKHIIRRPVICICNNLYTSSLRELKSVALNIHMPQINNRNLIRRLQMIASHEKINVEFSAVSSIVTICGGDIRRAINSLQFIATELNSSAITFETVQKYGGHEIFVKDKSLFEAWSSVFELGRHHNVRNRFEQIPQRIQRIISIYQHYSGESDRFYSGLFNNYLAACPGTTRMDEIRTVSRLFCENDLLLKHIYRQQFYSLMKYSFVTCAQIHLLLASVNRLYLSFPTADQILII